MTYNVSTGLVQEDYTYDAQNRLVSAVRDVTFRRNGASLFRHIGASGKGSDGHRRGVQGWVLFEPFATLEVGADVGVLGVRYDLPSSVRQ